jgi:hypothetical protein
MQTDLIQIMSNEALRHYARIGIDLSALKIAQRYDARAARAELARRDLIVALGEHA